MQLLPVIVLLLKCLLLIIFIFSIKQSVSYCCTNNIDEIVLTMWLNVNRVLQVKLKLLIQSLLKEN